MLDRTNWNRTDRSATDVIGITFAQLAGEAVCFVRLACLSERHRRFVQRTRSDRWIVIKESDAFKSFASIIEVSALQLNFTGKQTRFRVYATLGLKHHDFFCDFLRFIWLMSVDLDGAER